MNKIRPQTIQIYLPDGNPRSVRIAEITSRTVQVISFPRSKIDFITTREELCNVGIYFLVGSDEEASKPIVYIGEAEDCKTRIKQHNKSKDFWTKGLVVVSKTQFFTKSHIKYLEWLSYDHAHKADRYIIENATIPSKPFIPEHIESDLHDNFETIKILVSSLGFAIFDELEIKNKQDLILCKGKKADATGTYNEDGIVVFKNSKCNLDETKTIGSWLSNKRKTLIDQGLLNMENDTLVFTRDYVFNSPSTAAAVVLGRRANGWIEWKYEDGRTLDEVHRS